MEENLTYEEVSVEISDLQLQRLRNNEVAFVKVLQRNHQVESATQEEKEDMMKQYPYLIPSIQG